MNEGEQASEVRESDTCPFTDSLALISNQSLHQPVSQIMKNQEREKIRKEEKS